MGYTPTVVTIETITGTTYTLANTDMDKLLLFTSGSPVTIIIPAGSFTLVGADCTLVQAGAGQLSVVAAGGATLNTPGGMYKSAQQFATLTTIQTAANVWLLAGALST